MASLIDRGKRFLFGYDAVDETNRRKAVPAVVKSEDVELSAQGRLKLGAAANDIPRNFAIAAWAIRKHLDYVSTFAFQIRTGQPVLDDQIERLMRDWSRAPNCDVAARHSLKRLTRLLEARRTVQGDVFVLKLADGRVQAIEGDRVRAPTILPEGLTSRNFTHGVVTGPGGRALSYAICSRTDSGGYTFERMEPAANVLQLGYFDRIDQVRGVTPLAPAINSFRDAYEGINLALAKAKVTQLFAIAIYRQLSAEMGITTESDDSVAGSEKYDVDLGRGPIKLELQPGDRAEFLESHHPSTEFQKFCEVVISIALKALDIPYSFYDEGKANFSSGRQAWLLYDQSAQSKRDDLIELLDAITSWRLMLWMLDGTLKLPAGMSLQDLAWSWIPLGIPWIDPLKEIQADVTAVNNAMMSRQRLAKTRGENWWEIVDEIAEENAYLAAKGITIPAAPQTAAVFPDPADEERKAS